MPQSDSPASLAAIARLYYEVGLTHREISDALAISRVKVTRLLAEARRQGVVEITIHGAADTFPEVAQQLRLTFGLSGAWVAPPAHDAARSAEAAALIGAQALGEVMSHAELVAVGLSATLAAAVAKLPDQPCHAARFVPAAGGWGGWQRGLNPNELALRLAHHSGGSAFAFPAPLLGATGRQADQIRALPDVAGALEVARDADTVLSGVGGIKWSDSPLQTAVTEAEQAHLSAAGAVGDISGRFFTADCDPVSGPLDDRVIGLTLEEMAAKAQRLFVAHGQRKIPTLRAILDAGLATHLCTDLDTAQSLLGSIQSPRAGRSRAAG